MICKRVNLLGENLHSFDAYYKNVIFRNANLFIPYVNLGFINHELNPTWTIKYLDKCYLIAENLSYFKVYHKSPFIGKLKDDANYFFGGRNLDDNEFLDMEFESDNVYILIPECSKMSDKMWIPIETPNFQPNMSGKEVEKFFNYELFPPPLARKLFP